MTARLSFAVALILFSLNADALDNDIKVLVLMAPGAQLDDQQTDQIDRLSDVWTASSGGSPVLSTTATMTVVNTRNAFGNHIKPILQTPAGTPGPALATGAGYVATYNAVLSDSYNLAAQRNAAGADLVVVIVPSSTLSVAAGTICGFAPQQYWTDWPPGFGYFVNGGFAPPSGPSILGLDLRGSENAFMTILSDSPACTNTDATYGDNQINIVAHELGHLFGAGHDLGVSSSGPPPSQPGWYLFSDSHAIVNTLTIPIVNITLRLKTALGRSDSNIAICATLPCIQLATYSNSPSMDNAGTIDYVAASVANYRPIPSEPTQCGLSAPVNVRGWVTNYCDTNRDVTWHQVAWDDSCPAETDYFRSWGSINSPITGPWFWIGQYGAGARSHELINNTPGWVRLQACSFSEGCTGLSSSYYSAPSYCWDVGGGGDGPLP